MRMEQRFPTWQKHVYMISYQRRFARQIHFARVPQVVSLRSGPCAHMSTSDMSIMTSTARSYSAPTTSAVAATSCQQALHLPGCGAAYLLPCYPRLLFLEGALLIKADQAKHAELSVI